ncbi:MAG: aminopeptidase, partial [Planctomycetales bacterium]|nr:aminopeptidase [Planctomycetales bacterium]
DWFWRGWFYTTKEVDIALTGLRVYEINTRNPDIEKAIQRDKREDTEDRDVTDRRNKGTERLVDRYPELKDFYNEYDELDVTAKDRREYQEFIEELEDDEVDLLNVRQKFYVVDMQNIGGLVMPVHLRVAFADGSNREIKMPAEIWRQNHKKVSRLILSKAEITSIELDPNLESADTDRHNNHWPPTPVESRFELFKSKKSKNPMQEAEAEKERAEEEKSDEDEKPEEKPERD